MIVEAINSSNQLFILSSGFILGLLLFIVYINDIINASTLATFTLFADDTNIFSKINV